MTNNQVQAKLEVDTRLLTAAAVLVGVGGLLGVTGMLVGGSVLVSAGRQWVQQMDASPRELAQLKRQQANAASRAGMHAWQTAHPGSSS